MTAERATPSSDRFSSEIAIDSSAARAVRASETVKRSAAGERDDLIGALLDGRYLLGNVLGIGGTAVVFEATRISDSREVVVKTLRTQFVDNADLVRRLRREAEVSRTVAHPGIVPVLGEGTLPDGSPYIVVERVQGECLQKLLRRQKRLDPDVVGAISMRVASILHAAHVRGYVHRDIKPEHIVMDATDDGELRIRIIDFGVCAAHNAPQDERDREAGRVYGTPSYVSPEQASGEPNVDARADVFGLGVVMFEALTGRLPFTASNVANLLRRIIRDDAPRAGLICQDLPFEFDEVLARALAREPEQRFPSMRSFARALAPVVADRASVDRRLVQMLRVPSLDASQLVETMREEVA